MAECTCQEPIRQCWGSHLIWGTIDECFQQRELLIAGPGPGARIKGAGPFFKEPQEALGSGLPCGPETLGRDGHLVTGQLALDPEN